MSNYIGVRCPVCNKKFTEADDIVVCPVCGAPHHRSCYTATNQCAFVDDHLSGKEWKDPASQVPPQEPEAGSDGDTDASAKNCPQCGASNPSDSIFCRSCGNPLSIKSSEGQDGNAQNWVFPGFSMHVDTISMAYGGLSPDEEIEGETVRDIATYVGSGSAYYLPRFRLLSALKRTITFNLSALIFGFFYFLYRKMYLVGIFLFLLNIISSIPAYLYTWEAMPYTLYMVGLTATPPGEVNYAVLDHLSNLSTITRTISFAICFVASLFANRHYYNRVIAKVGEIRKSSEERGDPPQEYASKLAKSGGCNKAIVIVILALYCIAVLVTSSVVLYTQVLVG